MCVKQCRNKIYCVTIVPLTLKFGKASDFIFWKKNISHFSAKKVKFCLQFLNNKNFGNWKTDWKLKKELQQIK